MNRCEQAEVQRILSLARRRVLLGRTRLPLAAARRLVGPDCLYHLYFRHAGAPGIGRLGKARRRRG